MELPAEPQSSNQLDSFIDFLYGGSEGYVYLAAKKPNDPKDWKQEFFKYPSETEKLKKAIKNAQSTHDIYIAPALFNEQSGPRNTWHGNKESFKSSNVVWIDFDGNAPADWSDFAGPPSYIIQSSIEGRQHVYWRLNNPLVTVEEIERTNRSLAYNFNADTSGWDAVQVLRPPETFHHESSSQVKTLSAINISYDGDIFDSLPPIPDILPVTDWQLSELPDAQTVILRHRFPEDIVQLLQKEKSEIKDRSRSLQHLAYGCCEAGLTDNETFVILRLADDIWEKYKFRRDRDKRLADLIVAARNKHPIIQSTATEEQFTFAWSYQDFLNATIELDWILEGMLMEGGNMLMAGPSGVGKTQLSLEIAKHVALGKDFMHYKVPNPKKIGILSLEMGHPDLQIFLRKQDEALTNPERALLNENLIIIPHGEAWPLNTTVGQDRLKVLIEQFKWEGLFIDSIGSAIIGNLSSADIVQPFTNFNDYLRKEFGLFLWYIHHTRKSQPGQSRRNDLDDVYGDQYLVNRCTSGYIISPAKTDIIKVRNVKNRLAPMEPDYYIERTSSLGFTKMVSPPNPPSPISSAADSAGHTKLSTEETTTPGGMEV